MGLSIKSIKKLKGGNFYQQVSEITFDNSYPTGGESLTPRELGLNVIDFMEIESVGGYMFQYDHANQKIKVFTPTTGGASASAAEEVANATDLHTLVTRIKATGW